MLIRAAAMFFLVLASNAFPATLSDVNAEKTALAAYLQELFRCAQPPRESKLDYGESREPSTFVSGYRASAGNDPTWLSYSQVWDRAIHFERINRIQRDTMTITVSGRYLDLRDARYVSSPPQSGRGPAYDDVVLECKNERLCLYLENESKGDVTGTDPPRRDRRFTITFCDRPAAEAAAQAINRLIQLNEGAPPSLAEAYGLVIGEQTSGQPQVERLIPGSNADRLRVFHAGDVVERVEGSPAESPLDVERALWAAEVGVDRSAAIVVRDRNGARRSEVLTLSETLAPGGQETRQTFETFAREQGVDLGQVRQSFSGSGKLNCGGSETAAHLVNRNDLLVTSAAAFLSVANGACVFRKAQQCFFYRPGSDDVLQYPVLPETVFVGDACKNLDSRGLFGADNWAAVKLAAPVVDAQPYSIVDPSQEYRGANDPYRTLLTVSPGDMDFTDPNVQVCHELPTERRRYSRSSCTQPGTLMGAIQLALPEGTEPSAFDQARFVFLRGGVRVNRDDPSKPELYGIAVDFAPPYLWDWLRQNSPN